MARLPKIKSVKRQDYKWGGMGLEVEYFKPDVFGLKRIRRIFDFNIRKK